jgi:hypothetical protein
MLMGHLIEITLLDVTLIWLKALSEICLAGRCAELAWGTDLRREKYPPYRANCEVFLLVRKSCEGFMLFWIILWGIFSAWKLLLSHFCWCFMWSALLHTEIHTCCGMFFLCWGIFAGVSWKYVWSKVCDWWCHVKIHVIQSMWLNMPVQTKFQLCTYL